MNFKHAVGTLFVAGLVGTSGVAQAEYEFGGVIKSARSDVKKAARALQGADSASMLQLLEKLKTAEKQLDQAIDTLRILQESVAGAKAAAAQGGEGNVSLKSFLAAAPATPAPVPVKPDATKTPAPMPQAPSVGEW